MSAGSFIAVEVECFAEREAEEKKIIYIYTYIYNSAVTSKRRFHFMRECCPLCHRVGERVRIYDDWSRTILRIDPGLERVPSQVNIRRR